jgi:general secretion pathway protein C
MILAARIDQLKGQSPEQWLAAGARVLPPWVSGLLVIGIAFQAAQLVWALVPGPQANAPAPVVNTSAGGSAAGQAGIIDVEGLVKAHLFGEGSSESEPVVAQVVDAPDTRLSLKLNGVITHDIAEKAFALIADSRGDEKVYRINDPVPGGVKLHSIFEDRVLLNRAGTLETLRLPKDFPAGQTASVAPSVRRPTVPTRRTEASSLRQVISENASKITEIIRAAPHIQQGQMVGFRINPGRNRQQFAKLGLRPGDVVTDINGTAMTDPSQGLQVFESLGETSQATVTVLRNGNPQVLVIDTSQLLELQSADGATR